MTQDDAIAEDDRDPVRLSEVECGHVFDGLFPLGFCGRDVLGEVAPEGWAKSPLVRCFHPALDQIFEELTDFHHNLESLRRPGDALTAPPTLGDARTIWRSQSKRVHPKRECAELVGKCLWDIFSDNHDVAAKGRVVDIGSFRGAAGFIAERLNRDIRGVRYDYLDFYMGSLRLARRADLSPAYRTIFRRMRRLALEWIYHFPRLHVVTPGDPAEDDVPIEEYDPSESIRKDEERRRKAGELSSLQEDLKHAHLESVKEAQESDPPLIVRSHRDEYGYLPQGWPPEA